MKKETVTRWKKPLAAVLGAVLVFSTVCGAGNALPGAVKDALPKSVREVITPVTAQAATDRVMQEVTTANPTGGISDKDFVYFGSFPSSSYMYKNREGGTDPKWWVLDADHDNVSPTATTSEGAMFLLSQDLWGTGGTYGNVQFDSSGSSNQWQNSTARTWCTTFAGTAGVFSSVENAAIREISKTDTEKKGTNALYGIDWNGSSLSNEKVFFLSAEEAATYLSPTDGDESLKARYNGSPGYWWLRSPDASNSDFAGLVNDGGIVNIDLVSVDNAARPAFNLNLQSVLFTSAAAGVKSPGALGAAALKPVSVTKPTEWKLTLKDTARYSSFDAKRTDTGDVQAGAQITLEYSGAGDNGNDYVSAILKDSNGNILYYGNIANKSVSATDVKLTIPAGIPAGDYTLGIFAEQCNGDYKTDYASAVKEVPVTVSAPSTPGPAPTPTPPPVPTPTPDPDPAPTPTPAPPASSGGCPYGHASFHLITLRSADEHNDGEMAYVCSACGHELYRAFISGYGVFQKNTAEKIRSAAQGATVSVSTKRWISFNREVMEALAARPDVMITVSFLDGGYRGSRFAFTIPAGTDVKALWNEEGYAGFKFLGGRFGLRPGM